jgi:hypothetical protein
MKAFSHFDFDSRAMDFGGILHRLHRLSDSG